MFPFRGTVMKKNHIYPNGKNYLKKEENVELSTKEEQFIVLNNSNSIKNINYS